MTGKKGMKGSGGYRPNARRPLKFGEPVKRLTFQVPQSRAEELKAKILALIAKETKAP